MAAGLSERFGSDEARAYVVDRVAAENCGYASPCWIWKQHRTYKGYATANLRKCGKKRNYLIHRLSYEAFVAPIPYGFEVDHLCNIAACVNPDHLEAVTPAENRRRQVERATHCRRGHRYPIDASRRPSAPRHCLECAAIRAPLNNAKRAATRREKLGGKEHRTEQRPKIQTMIAPHCGSVTIP